MTNVTLPVLLDDRFAPDDEIRPAKYSSPAGPALHPDTLTAAMRQPTIAFVCRRLRIRWRVLLMSSYKLCLIIVMRQTLYRPPFHRPTLFQVTFVG